jgi:hypothetical protein
MKGTEMDGKEEMKEESGKERENKGKTKNENARE